MITRRRERDVSRGIERIWEVVGACFRCRTRSRSVLVISALLMAVCRLSGKEVSYSLGLLSSKALTLYLTRYLCPRPREPFLRYQRPPFPLPSLLLRRTLLRAVQPASFLTRLCMTIIILFPLLLSPLSLVPHRPRPAYPFLCF
ncbi:hypothetical protein BCR35DRAFT_103652 [Leucosporidium creatinivorum]|uniref:Uncharacterized protein n=1 Tax=Leucosporidium creatinivorum TaxID=106004 RepID=A0A1Y2G135_9BASI|nr:hypothetical protein BCR35DRAFT_103652 [Leucosporidium creatinivorum]